MLIAQLSDPHILDPSHDGHHGVNNNERLSLAIESINSERPRPSVVVITGDLAMNGRPDQYAELVRRLGDLEIPFLPIGGNHDDRDHMKAALGEIPWADCEHASWSVVVEGVRIIGLDSTVPGMAGAHIGPPLASWLNDRLAEAAEPVLLAMHHPPFVCGIDWMDRPGFDGFGRFVSTLKANPMPGLIICGHLHRPIHSSVAGIRASVGISTIQHVALDLLPDGPEQMILDPVGYQLHSFDGKHWVTHTRYIDNDTEPFPY